MNETYIAVDNFSIKKMHDGRFGVFASDHLLDQFKTFRDAAHLTQELFIAKHASRHPEDVGSLKFMASGASNGNMFVVIDQTSNGVLVQRVGEPHYRLEVSPKELSDPPAY